MDLPLESWAEAAQTVGQLPPPLRLDISSISPLVSLEIPFACLHVSPWRGLLPFVSYSLGLSGFFHLELGDLE